MPELEQALRAVGRNLELPDTPDLTGAVRRRLAERPRQPFWRRRALVVALAVVAVAVGAVLAIPDARSTIKDWLGIGNITIRYVEELPSVEKATGDLGLGERVSLEEARERAAYTVMVPQVDGLDDPPRVYFREADQQVAFLYGTEDEPKLLVTQAGVGGAVEKVVGLGATDTERVTVDGQLGIWLSGDKHAIFYPGAEHEEPFRLVGNALLFENDLGVTVRIEAEVSRDEAIRIAESMR